VQMTPAQVCFASKATGTVVDVLRDDGKTFYYGKTLEDVRREYPDAEKMTLDAFCTWKAEQQRTPIAWAETTEARFYDMLGCLPPAAYGGGGFLVGEPMDHDAGNGQPRYDAYRQVGERYLVASRPLTRAEFRAECA